MGQVTLLDKELKHKHVVTQTTDEIAKANDKREEYLTKAKELLFEKSKICQNQELQIKTLAAQNLSLKDVLEVNKEMLEVRNCEVEHMKVRLESVEGRLKTEKDLMEKKFNVSQKMYNHLKAEHELQSTLFKELKDGYKKRLEMVTKELNIHKQDKLDAKAANNGGASTSQAQPENGV